MLTDLTVVLDEESDRGSHITDCVSRQEARGPEGQGLTAPKASTSGAAVCGTTLRSSLNE